MPVLKKTRWEKFAQHAAKGMTDAKAYEAAGFKPNDGNCGRMRRNPEVAARILELQSAAAEKAVITIEDIARQLDEDREFARSCGSAGAAVSATMGKAKVLGLIIDKLAGPTGGAIVVKIEGDDKGLL